MDESERTHNLFPRTIFTIKELDEKQTGLLAGTFWSWSTWLSACHTSNQQKKLYVRVSEAQGAKFSNPGRVLAKLFSKTTFFMEKLPLELLSPYVSYI